MGDISQWARKLSRRLFPFYNPGHEYKSPRQLTRGGQRWNKKRANKESWDGRYRPDIEARTWKQFSDGVVTRGEKTWLIFPGPEINFAPLAYIPSTRWLDLWANLNDTWFFNVKFLWINCNDHSWAQFYFYLLSILCDRIIDDFIGSRCFLFIISYSKLKDCMWLLNL